MTTYYTGKGDNGSTSIIGGSPLNKGDILIEAIGDVDELNSAIGVAFFYTRDEELRAELNLIQNELFTIGALLSSVHSKEFSKAKVGRKQIERLEKSIQNMGDKMPQLTKFVLPAGSEESSHLHLARSIARRAERHVAAAAQKYEIDGDVLAYLNRLSSFLFASALYLNHKSGVKENNPVY